MKEVKCPNCSRILNVKETAKEVVCQKCLDDYSKSFIMIESPDVKKSHTNLGGGFFEKNNE